MSITAQTNLNVGMLKTLWQVLVWQVKKAFSSLEHWLVHMLRRGTRIMHWWKSIHDPNDTHIKLHAQELFAFDYAHFMLCKCTYLCSTYRWAMQYRENDITKLGRNIQCGWIKVKKDKTNKLRHRWNTNNNTYKTLQRNVQEYNQGLLIHCINCWYKKAAALYSSGCLSHYVHYDSDSQSFLYPGLVEPQLKRLLRHFVNPTVGQCCSCVGLSTSVLLLRWCKLDQQDNPLWIQLSFTDPLNDACVHFGVNRLPSLKTPAW